MKLKAFRVTQNETPKIADMSVSTNNFLHLFVVHVDNPSRVKPRISYHNIRYSGEQDIISPSGITSCRGASESRKR